MSQVLSHPSGACNHGDVRVEYPVQHSSDVADENPERKKVTHHTVVRAVRHEGGQTSPWQVDGAAVGWRSSLDVCGARSARRDPLEDPDPGGIERTLFYPDHAVGHQPGPVVAVGGAGVDQPWVHQQHIPEGANREQIIGFHHQSVRGKNSENMGSTCIKSSM